MTTATSTRRTPGHAARGWTDLARVFELDAPVGRLVAPTVRLPAGPLKAGTVGAPFVVVSGAVLQRATLGRRTAAALLGPGDVLCAEARDDAPWTHATRALTPTIVAAGGRVSGPRAALDLALLEATERQAARLASQGLLVQLTQLEDRLARLLPQVAERWGVVTPQGIVLPRFLRHWVLADLVGVRRPSLTTAAQRLERDGRLRRLPDGRWLLAPGFGTSAAEPA